MRVGFDISQIAHGGGVAVYTQNLAEKLEQFSEIEPVFFYSSLRKKYQGNLTHVKSFSIPPTILEILFNRFRMPIEKLIGDIDIYHSSDWIQPKTKALKITTYHDLTPIKYPLWSHKRVVEVQKRRLKLVEEEIDHVIAVSEATKNDLMQVSKIPEDKITVVYEGVSSIFKLQERAKVEKFKKDMGLPNNYILAISGVGQRRNLEAVKKVTANYNLIIAGETLPFLPYEKLPLLYCGADLLLYPSFYEGFGLPILEAMACGIPVITSNVSSMPEVGGDGAIYVNPHDLSDIKGKLKMVMEDKTIREEMTTKGFSQAKKFSWEKTALETVKIYKKLLT